MTNKELIATEIIKQYVMLQSAKIRKSHLVAKDDFKHAMEMDDQINRIDHKILRLALKLASYFVEVSFGFANQYPHTVVVQFQNSSSLSMHSALDFRYSTEKLIGIPLEMCGLGICNGGQMSFHAINCLFSVSNVEKSVKLIVETLINQELIAWAKIASLEQDSQDWILHHPKDGCFDISNFSN